MSPREAALLILTEKSGVSRGVLSSVENRSDRALTERLVNGTTKWQGLLDVCLSSFSNRPLGTLSSKVLAALRLGAFQLLILGTPAHASLSTVVECLRTKGERGFVNGVLRALSRNLGHIEMPSLDDDAYAYASARFSYPLWMARFFIDRFGVYEGLRICDIGNRPPPLILRVNRLKTTPEAFLSRLVAEGIAAELGVVPGSIRLSHGTDVTSLPGFYEGEFLVQDEAAMVVSLALAPYPGQAVWDACAAPGGKTAHLAEMMKGQGTLLATDIDEQRVGLVKETLARMGFPIGQVFAADAAGSAGKLDSRIEAVAFDRILLDAPCSGLGVIRRNADLRWNRRGRDIPAMAKRQRSLLNSVAARLKPGGVLVYSTCTLTREENEDTWAEFLRNTPDMTPEDPASAVGPEVSTLFASEPFAGMGFRYLLPQRSETDGFFIARARRLSKGI